MSPCETHYLPWALKEKHNSQLLPLLLRQPPVAALSRKKREGCSHPSSSPGGARAAPGVTGHPPRASEGDTGRLPAPESSPCLSPAQRVAGRLSTQIPTRIASAVLRGMWKWKPLFFPPAKATCCRPLLCSTFSSLVPPALPRGPAAFHSGHVRRG